MLISGDAVFYAIHVS